MAIIDDDSIIRTMLKELLSKIDVGDRYEVKIEVFKDGIEFLSPNGFTLAISTLLF